MVKVCAGSNCTEIVTKSRAKYCSDKCKFTSWRENVKSNPNRLAKDKERRLKKNKEYFDSEQGKEYKRQYYQANKNKWPSPIPEKVKRARTKIKRSSRGLKSKYIWVQGKCLNCGEQFLARTSSGEARFCSDRCSGRRTRHSKFRDKVLARDNFTCQICFKPLNMDCSFPHYQYPTLDHIIPVFMGGPDVLENLRAAHFICNIERGQRDYAEFCGDGGGESYPILVGDDNQLRILTGGNLIA